LLFFLLCYLTNASLAPLRAAILDQGTPLPDESSNVAPGFLEEQKLAPIITSRIPRPCTNTVTCNPPQYCGYSPIYDTDGCRISCGPLSCICPAQMEQKCGPPDQCTPKCTLPNPYCPWYTCVNGCHCRDGLIRDSSGNCIDPSQCVECPIGQVREDCGKPPEYVPTCDNRNPSPPDWYTCRKGCFCEPGRFRNRRNQCLTADQCVRQCCDPAKEPGKGVENNCFVNFRYACCPITGEWVCANAVAGNSEGDFWVIGVVDCPGNVRAPYGIPCAPGTAYNPVP